MAEQQLQTPTQPFELPSKGLLYPEGNPLSSGIIELYMPSAMHEDILTNRNYINQGIVIDKFLQAIIATKINYDDLLIGDKNAVLIASRILAYGNDYTFTYSDSNESQSVTVDLSKLDNKAVDESRITKGVNEFTFLLPLSNVEVIYKLLTHRDEQAIEAEIKGLQKVNKNISVESTTRLNHSIISVNGNRDQKTIRDFVKTIPMRDSKALKQDMISMMPDIDMSFEFIRKDGEVVEGLTIPMTVDFFWPK